MVGHVLGRPASSTFNSTISLPQTQELVDTISSPMVLPLCSDIVISNSDEVQISHCYMPSAGKTTDQTSDWILNTLHEESWSNTTGHSFGMIMKQKKPEKQGATEEGVTYKSADGTRIRLELRPEDVSRRLTCSSNGPENMRREDSLDVCRHVPHRYELARTKYLLPESGDGHGCNCMDWSSKGTGFRACNCDSCDHMFGDHLKQICALASKTCIQDMKMSSGYLRDVAKNAVYVAYTEGMTMEETEDGIDGHDELWSQGCKSGSHFRTGQDYTGKAKHSPSDGPEWYSFLKAMIKKYNLPWVMKVGTLAGILIRLKEQGVS